jgi:excisionase family DNA binding protein
MTTETTFGKFLTKGGAVRYSGVAQRTLDRAKANGELPYIKFSARKVLFRAQDLDAWLSKRLVNAGQHQG